ncbi:IS3 family transposase [Emticicia sp. 21SJ11W-3]|uniref:IS3 family transposase n=1 Tax=Emticicia sp. 21SJ11W-3 TaxID=2916755 RepID=UPI0020A198A2|nr:IS3 family transposase [Emticicia sp. 21SJ11W-3]UTA66646.1 IS3 family transposase [Emticicia sp. 21SJ11W-3]
MVDATSPLSIRRQCDLLSVSRSSLYYKSCEESVENLEIMRLMDEHYFSHPSYGVLRMQDFVDSKGYVANVKRIRRLLRLMRQQALYPKKNLSKPGEIQYKYPYLLKGLQITRSNQVWQIDITYIPMAKGFLYLTAIIDVYSRFVTGWDLSNTLDAKSCHAVLRAASERYGKPEIINSDQGSQFTCEAWLQATKGMQISMDGKGRALDNIYIERLWRSVKYDYVYVNVIEDGKSLYRGLKNYFQHYNIELRHQGIGRQTPQGLYLIKAA